MTSRSLARHLLQQTNAIFHNTDRSAAAWLNSMSEQANRARMTAWELQRGAQLLLEYYQRCGLMLLPAHVQQSLVQSFSSSVTADPPVQSDFEQTSSLLQGQLAIGPESTLQTAAKGETPITGGLDDQPSSMARAPAGDPKSSSSIVADTPSTSTSGNWSLPVLSLDERSAEFERMNERVQACRLCSDIVTFRRQTVFGDGTLQPTICFFGEAPGADEDRVGEPFVGAAGQLLTRIIEAMGLKRAEVYILNALKCRPPQNRTPVPDEIDHCRQYAQAQLDILQPKFIVCLGAVAVRSLLQINNPVGQLRGRFHHYRGSQVVVTYHPAYLLRNEAAKKLVWEDMQMLMRELGIKASKSG